MKTDIVYVYTNDSNINKYVDTVTIILSTLDLILSSIL